MLFDYGTTGRKVFFKQSSNSRKTLAAKTSLFPVLSIAVDNPITSQPTKYLVRNILHKLINE
ncbi:MAG: membrane-bound lytic murein transglycosylase [Colwellia sp.]|jgi:membrane-bound lytic murein transglycosylase